MTYIKFKNGFQPTVGSNLFTNFFSDLLLDSTLMKGGNGNVPPVNIIKTDDGFQLSLLAPGFNKEDFKIKVEEKVLSISAEVKAEEEKSEEPHFSRREFKLNSFKRSFELPESVEMDHISANYLNGLLQLNIPVLTATKQPLAKEIVIA